MSRTPEEWKEWLRVKRAEADRLAMSYYVDRWSRSQREEQDYVEEQQQLAEEYNDGKENDGDNTKVDQGTVRRLAIQKA